MPQEVIIAVCLVLVLEGILPFLVPDAWRRAVLKMAMMPPRQIRIMGLMSMLTGVCLLYFFN